MLLDKHNLIKYDKRTGQVQVTALGRVASAESARRSPGGSDADIARYRVDPDVEPPRLLAGDAEGQEWGGDFKRGDVRKVDHDIGRSKL